MATKIEIYNLALRNIGETPVESTTEQSDNANVLSDFYDLRRKGLLREYPWAFARKTAELVATSTTPPDWSYEFAIPSDSIYVLSVAEGGRDFTDDMYEIRGTSLYCDASSIFIRYTCDITDTSKFDSLFVTAFGYLLAADIAMPRTGDPAIQANMANGYLNAISKATGMNGAESKLDRVAECGYIKARR